MGTLLILLHSANCNNHSFAFVTIDFHLILEAIPKVSYSAGTIGPAILDCDYHAQSPFESVTTELSSSL